VAVPDDNEEPHHALCRRPSPWVVVEPETASAAVVVVRVAVPLVGNQLLCPGESMAKAEILFVLNECNV
jgi:hypothetical protein